jgi:pimeloyl-ACP methyl ester carboxylesterase
MRLSRSVFPSVLPLLLLASCVVHNTPVSQPPNRMELPRTAEAFVDQNGTFYPDYWRTFDAPPRSALKYAYSLTTMAGWTTGGMDSLRAEEERILDQFEAFLAPRQRVFILIHGFNSGFERSEQAYERIENAIAFTESDAVVEFHWDGLMARGGPLSKPLGAGKIWFNAAGYSQLGGARGLRRILNRLHDKEVVIIAHSRGASVALSAFSNPPYAPSFITATQKEHGIDVYGDPPLRENGNRITAIFLAPAIGAVDFTTPRRPDGAWSYRGFGSQVVRIHHTVNCNDPVLRKFIGIADRLNPTDLGYDQRVATQVSGAYDDGFLTNEPIYGLKKHDFELYVSHPRFKPMLESFGITVTPYSPVSVPGQGGRADTRPECPPR